MGTQTWTLETPNFGPYDVFPVIPTPPNKPQKLDKAKKKPKSRIVLPQQTHYLQPASTCNHIITEIKIKKTKTNPPNQPTNRRPTNQPTNQPPPHPTLSPDSNIRYHIILFTDMIRAVIVPPFPQKPSKAQTPSTTNYHIIQKTLKSGKKKKKRKKRKKEKKAQPGTPPPQASVHLAPISP